MGLRGACLSVTALGLACVAIGLAGCGDGNTAAITTTMTTTTLPPITSPPATAVATTTTTAGLVSLRIVCNAVQAYDTAWLAYVKTNGADASRLATAGFNLGLVSGEYGAPFGPEVTGLDPFDVPGTRRLLARMSVQCSKT